MWKYDEKYGTLQKHKERLLAVSKPNQRWERRWKYLVAQSCLTLCDPVDCSLPGSSVHGILQARILEWVAFLSWLSSWSRNKPRSPALQVGSSLFEPPGKPFRWDWVKASWNFWEANALLYRKTESSPKTWMVSGIAQKFWVCPNICEWALLFIWTLAGTKVRWASIPGDWARLSQHSTGRPSWNPREDLTIDVLGCPGSPSKQPVGTSPPSIGSQHQPQVSFCCSLHLPFTCHTLLSIYPKTTRPVFLASFNR